MNHKQIVHNHLLTLAIIILVGAIGATTFFLWPTEQRELQTINYRPLPFPRWRTQQNRPSALPAPSTIDSWMTFDYLNKIFNLPPDYLKTSLNITDSRYPFLTISRLAREQKQNTTGTLSIVEQAISNHLIGK